MSRVTMMAPVDVQRLQSMGYPYSSDMLQAIQQALAGRLPNNFGSPVRWREEVYYHRQPYPVAGTTQLAFWNASSAANVTNWPGAVGLPNEACFIVRSMGIRLQVGVDAAGARQAAGAQIATGAGTTAAIATLSEQVRTITESATAYMSVGDFKLVDSEYGLDFLPGGGGFYADVAFGTTTADQAAACFFQNGAPFSSNERRCNYPIPCNKQVLGNLSWQAAQTVTTAILHFNWWMKGWLLTAANF